ncbi:hotdog fold domain-containing protein [Luteimonas sp. A534]
MTQVSPTHRSRLVALFERMSRLPMGRWLFARAVCFRAPYFGTIAPRFLMVAQGRCEVAIPDRRRVHNHIGSVHAIALCNLAELAGGVMLEASLPPDMRWIPKGMTVEYVKKAVGTMHAVAQPAALITSGTEGYELPVVVDVRNAGGDTVFRASIAMWVSPRPRAQA